MNAEQLVSIADLQLLQTEWVIKARVTWKTAISHWDSGSWEGDLFSIDLVDESGEIRATAFGSYCNRIFSQIEMNKVYLFSNGSLNDANTRYWNHKHRYEMRFNSNTIVEECEDDGSIPEAKFELVPISQVENMESQEFVDTIGVCTHVSGLYVPENFSRTCVLRDLTLVHPMSMASVRLTLWYDEAINCDAQLQSLILVKGARINIFDNEVKLNGGSILKINALDRQEDNMVHSCGTIFKIHLGSANGPDYFQCKNVKHLVNQGTAFYMKATQDFLKEDNEVLTLNLSVGNWTSNRWVTCFNKDGQRLLNYTAQFHPEENEAF